ncbi:MAG: DNA modification methylase [Pseudomonadota bacterium]
MITFNARGIKAPLIAKTKGLRDAAASATKMSSVAAGNMPNDLLPDLSIEPRAIDSLRPATRQTRKMTAQQIERVITSIQRFGFVGAILVKHDQIVDGHVRLEAMKALGPTEIPCIEVSHLSAEEVRLLSISMNVIQEKGSWDLEPLRIELIELKDAGFDLEITGLTMPEIDLVLLDPDAASAADTLDAVPDVAPVVVSRLGDQWALGDHRLICGDACDPHVYAALLGSDRVATVFSDPPYNCKIEGNVSGLGKVVHGEFAMASGEMTDAEFGTFLTDYLACCRDVCVDRAVIFACMNWREYPRLETAGRAAELKQLSMVVWDKGAGGMGSPYRSCHEIVGVFCTGDTPAVNNVQLGKHGRDRTNVWHYPGANKPGSSAAKALKDHPTPKPVELVVNAILDFTSIGDIVLDPFMGSGTTIVACMEAHRIARGIELDPKYVDVALRRFMALSDTQPRLIETDESFDEVAKRRALETTAATENHD